MSGFDDLRLDWNLPRPRLVWFSLWTANGWDPICLRQTRSNHYSITKHFVTPSECCMCLKALTEWSAMQFLSWLPSWPFPGTCLGMENTAALNKNKCVNEAWPLLTLLVSAVSWYDTWTGQLQGMWMCNSASVVVVDAICSFFGDLRRVVSFACGCFNVKYV